MSGLLLEAAEHRPTLRLLGTFSSIASEGSVATSCSVINGHLRVCYCIARAWRVYLSIVGQASHELHSHRRASAM